MFINTALLTALIETPLFWLAGYKNLTECLYFALINIITNILLNSYLFSSGFPSFIKIILCELVVVVLESVMCCCAMNYVYKFTFRKLILTMLFTNFVSFLSGIVYSVF